MMRIEFDDTPLQPVTGPDADGVEHTFEFRSMLVPTGHALYARERVPDEQEGYEFSVLGDFDASVWDLFRVLYDRIRHGLAFRHVSEGNSAGGSPTHAIWSAASPGIRSAPGRSRCW
jgi:hypothetical protein